VERKSRSQMGEAKGTAGGLVYSF